MSKIAFSGDHLTDEEKLAQAKKCIDILSTADQGRFTQWQNDFYASICEQNEKEDWIPTYRQLNALKDMVDRHA